MSWKDLEVWKHKSGITLLNTRLTLGKPYIRLSEGGLKFNYPLSISHEKDYVVAVVMNIPIPQTESIPQSES